jgi:hypothetical protein
LTKKHTPTEQEWKMAIKDLKEIRRCILRDRKYTISIGDEAIMLIDHLISNPSKRDARKLYNRIEQLGLCQDLGSFVLDTFNPCKEEM